jgi:hypothetical protein
VTLAPWADVWPALQAHGTSTVEDAIRLSLCSLLLAAACGGPSPGATPPPDPLARTSAELRASFAPPAGTVPVNLVVDDSANRAYRVDGATRLLTTDRHRPSEKTFRSSSDHGTR